jgi:ribosomal protein S6
MEFKNYELLVLFNPEVGLEKQDEFKNKIESLVKEVDGSVFAYDKWGKHILSFPIQKHTYGIYTLIRFKIKNTVESKKVLDVLKQYIMVRCNDFVMRHMFTILIGEVNADYRRPDALEMAPRRDKNYGSPSAYLNYEKTQISNGFVDSMREHRISGAGFAEDVNLEIQ